MKFGFNIKGTVIFVNSTDGSLYFDTALNAIGNVCLDEIINNVSTSSMNLLVAKNSGIPAKCGIWVENDEWYPIIKFSPDQKFCLVNGDWIFDEEQLNEDTYIKDQLKSCEMIVKFVEEFVK